MTNKIKTLKIGIASPEKIRSWSLGEVEKPLTIDARTDKFEVGGLFDEKIFGSEFSVSRKGTKTISNNRRIRMGHIELASPIAHPWFVKELPNPSKISLVLGLTYKVVEAITYYEGFIVIDNAGYDEYFAQKEFFLRTGKDENVYRRKIKKIITELILPKIEKDSYTYDRANAYIEELGNATTSLYIYDIIEFIKEQTGIDIGFGAQALKTLLSNIDLKKELESISNQLKSSSAETDKAEYNKLLKRSSVIQSFINSKTKPEWMILDVIPVIPPENRPLTTLLNGKKTTRDINNLYRNIIIINARLRMRIEREDPIAIINMDRNDLQHAVDSLFDNASKKNPTLSKQKQPIKSLTDYIKGKSGFFRQNLLGKRVDFSGRSAIVSGPELKLYEVGIPSEIILQIFNPFIVSELIREVDENGVEIEPIATNTKDAKKLILQQDPIIWPIVRKIISERPVLLNRAPTLHRLGIQAFEIKMIDGKAIRLHPLTTTAFNADFDGDTMALFLPLSVEAINEARSLLLASKHIISHKDGKPIITPTIDMLVGIYYMTTEKLDAKGQGTIFSTIEEATNAYEQGNVDLQALVGIDTNNYLAKGMSENKILITTVGKILFNKILPLTMTYVNSASKWNVINNEDILPEEVTFDKAIANRKLADPIKKGIVSKIITHLFENYPSEIAQIADSIKDIGFKYATKSGVTFSIYDLPKYTKKNEYIKTAEAKVEQLKDLYEQGLLTDDERYTRVLEVWTETKAKVVKDMEEIIDSPEQQDQSIIIMNKSGARGNISQFTQLIGMRGLMAKSYNYTLNEGQVIRDTIEIPVKTSFLEGLSVSEYFNASYSARKAMADTALKTSKSGYMTRKLVDSSQDVVIVSDDCGTTKPLVVSAILNKEGQIIESLAERIEGRYTISAIKSGNKIIVPADTMISKEQAIAIEKEGIQTVEIRSPIHCNCKNGVCKKCYGKDISTNSLVEMGATVGVVAGQSLGEPVTQINMNTKHTGGVSGGTQIAQGYERLKQLLDVINPKEFEKAAIAPLAGKVISITKNDEEISILIKNSIDEAIVSVNRKSILIVKPDDIVELGQKLTQGSINMKQLLEIRDIEAVRHYIINEVQRVYRAQGIEVNDKYIEIIVAQMTNKLIILNQGDSDLSIGQTINASELVKINSKLLSEGKTPLLARNEIFGLDDIPSKSNSFLSAASFQDTKKILVDSAIKGQIDDLTSLNANVMLGNLIPAGTAIKDVEEIIADGQETFREEY